MDSKSARAASNEKTSLLDARTQRSDHLPEDQDQQLHANRADNRYRVSRADNSPGHNGRKDKRPDIRTLSSEFAGPEFDGNMDGNSELDGGNLDESPELDEYGARSALEEAIRGTAYDGSIKIVYSQEDASAHLQRSSSLADVHL